MTVGVSTVIFLGLELNYINPQILIAHPNYTQQKAICKTVIKEGTSNLRAHARARHADAHTQFTQ